MPEMQTLPEDSLHSPTPPASPPHASPAYPPNTTPLTRRMNAPSIMSRKGPGKAKL